MRKAGGVANPLGSNLANIYLMYIVAPLYVVMRWKLKGDAERLQRFKNLICTERKLIYQHLGMAFLMFAHRLSKRRIGEDGV